ncbi:hypothetical protein BKA82DRAFT_803645 [Pisolithus tinctorius]|uniref:Uncharacterized protein n=1 Tax=Pisolithus tinctorius Marx 270 TaxID=870435 RepID=A0A0C3PS17_PISTI|nr:hypothetical protein BKA82DRAFT_803645 [Pisolithus tinctorius]KIO11891.1 hypothetical protein M404DRAFT_803645 [Pisolithus tinctorius Marx 270]
MRARVQLHRPSRPPTACCQFSPSHDSAPAARFHSVTTMTSFLVLAYEPQDICRDQRYTVSLRWHVCWPLHIPTPTPTRRPPSYEYVPHLSLFKVARHAAITIPNREQTTRCSSNRRLPKQHRDPKNTIQNVGGQQVVCSVPNDPVLRGMTNTPGGGWL